MKTRSFGERLDEKSAQALFANHLRERYHYNPAMAEAIFRDALFVRTLLDPTAREDGQVVRYFPKATESAGKPLRDCAYVAVHLTVYAPGDDEFLARYGPKMAPRLCDNARSNAFATRPSPRPQQRPKRTWRPCSAATVAPSSVTSLS